MRVFSNVGLQEAFHPLSHHKNKEENFQKLVKIQRYQSERMVKFAQRLASIQDGESSILDQSIFLFGSNMSNSNLHNNFPLPTSVVGGGAGKIKGNQHLRYPDRTPIANLHRTLLERIGYDPGKFGDSDGLFTEL